MAIDEDAMPKAVDLEAGSAPGSDEVLRHRRHEDGVRVGRHARRGGQRPWLALLSASSATVAILTVGAAVIAGSAGRSGVLGVPGRLSAPAPGASRPGFPLPDSPLPSATGSPGIEPSPGSTGSGPAPLSPVGSAQTNGPAPDGPADPGAPAAPPDASRPAPVVAVTGRITNVVGLCLSAIGVDNRVRLWNCDGSTGQAWTLATDGTLRALGQCLQPSDGLVWLRNCDAGAAQQWRIGAAISLVNSASADCLGDLRAGVSRGTPQRTAPCDQSDPQRWTLPL